MFKGNEKECPCLLLFVIFACFSILKYANVFPDKIVTNLQTAMSLTQLITASIGAFIASGFYFLEREEKK